MTLAREALDLCELSRAELALRFHNAAPLRPEAIAGHQYCGVSLGLPRLVEKLSWKKFSKAFEMSRAGTLSGYNVRTEDDALDLPWRAKTRDGKPWTFGAFQVVEEHGDLLLDYGKGTTGYSPLRRLRDPLRRIDEDGDLHLGRSLIQLWGKRRIATPSWFVLQRAGRV
ncbi:MAG: hypothetical protein JKY56_24525 [Kofleriaceae bacterium]|nr:hypothetical protein [Kofleriaceae bacterium]